MPFQSLFQVPFYPVVYWLDVPREVAEEFHSEFEDAVDLFTGYPAGDRERQFTTWGTRDGIYLSGSDPEKPGVFVLAQTGKGRQGLDLDELDIDPDATFVEGFSQGSSASAASAARKRLC